MTTDERELTDQEKRHAVKEQTRHIVDGPIVLLDEWTDGYIESQGWVEVMGDDGPGDAVAACEAIYPLEDRDDSERYEANPADKSWQRPSVDKDAWQMHLGGEGSPWEDCKPEDDGAVEFWNVHVVCPT